MSDITVSSCEIRHLPAPAKLNLFLHITGRRADGYHLIESVFQLIDWQDTIHLSLRDDGHISREDINSLALSAPLPAQDLCTRAAHALREAAGCTMGAHIQLEKRIPAQAGLGGGSSDAATCLLGLNRLWNLGLPLAKLEQIGLALGADVPFFLRGRNAWVSGIGEVIEPLGDGVLDSRQHFAVIKPTAGLPTASIFGHALLKRDSPHAIIADFAEHPYDFGHNDLQSVGELIEPQVPQALALLKQHGFKPRMTGSGSAVFAPCPAGFQFDQSASGRSVPSGWQQRVCKSLSVHPLLGWAERGW
jgi:4-diphosphocytidyl-2-C-methyl-D-erythritol kinase